MKKSINTHSVLVYNMTPKLAKSLSELLKAKRMAIKNANNYLLFRQSYDEFVGAADEVCSVLEGMVVGGKRNECKQKKN